MTSTTHLTNAGRLRGWFSVFLAVGVVSAMAIFLGGISAGSAGATQAPVPLWTLSSLRDLVVPGDFEHGQPVSTFYYRRHRGR